MTMTITALTLDLDDTLWPVMPTLLRAEAVLQDWLRAHAPATAAAFDVPTLQRLRGEVGRRHPALAHDLTALRLITLREALAAAGDDPALAEPAFTVFFAERQRVQWYGDVRPALERLAARFPLLALSNGNAELAATGLAPYFVGAVSARSCGVAKPAVRIFEAACAELRCTAGQVMHVGDDWTLDVVGARRAGLHTAWIRRPEAALHRGPASADADDAPAGLHLHLDDLLVLADALGA
ncbi:HAD-IA family hydrolase [Sphaerotilus sp.]|uniref:HAD family hydrolase n=1 Tax=Sphaerotilus sp. TaxID=2093942 RepID=UPI00286E9646|nr:HAD-IA family hydrolase [Sphaerotilus sp.]